MRAGRCNLGAVSPTCVVTTAAAYTDCARERPQVPGDALNVCSAPAPRIGDLNTVCHRHNPETEGRKPHATGKEAGRLIRN